MLLAGVAACAVTPAGEARGPSDIRIDRQTVLRLPQGLVFVPPEPGDPDMLGTVIAGSGWMTQRLVLFAASRDADGVPEVEAAGWRR